MIPRPTLDSDMRLKVLSTGSHGNVYLLQDGDEILILDAGLPIRRIIDAIDNPENVVGCLVTHEHGDHSKAAYDLAKRGIKVYASAGTWAAIQGDKPRLWSQCYAYKNWSVGLGRYQVFPFPTEHDAAEPMGFVIRNNATNEKLLYATDTFFLRNTFPGMHYWLVECNYCEDQLDRMLYDGLIDIELRNRLKKSHMSLGRLKEALAANDLSVTRKIVLCHLSDQRSDERRMVSEIQEATGIETVATDAQMEIPLELAPF